MTNVRENRMCIVCGEAPAATTEGTCAFCDSKDSLDVYPAAAMVAAPVAGMVDGPKGYEASFVPYAMMSIAALVAVLVIVLTAFFWAQSKQSGNHNPEPPMLHSNGGSLNLESFYAGDGRIELPTVLLESAVMPLN